MIPLGPTLTSIRSGQELIARHRVFSAVGDFIVLQALYLLGVAA